MALPMLHGRAIGGPRNGIVLTANEAWDGRIRYPDTGKVREWYYGYYYWCTERGTWVWATKRKPVLEW